MIRNNFNNWYIDKKWLDVTLSNLKDVQVNGNLGIILCSWKEKKQSVWRNINGRRWYVRKH